MKFLLISVASAIILLGLLFIFGKPPKYSANIAFYDGKTNQVIPNQKASMSYYDMVGTIGTRDVQADSNGYADTYIAKINKSNISIRMYSSYYGDSVFSFGIEPQQIEEGTTMYLTAKDKRSDKKQRDQPLIPPRMEIKVGKRKLF
jgi:hypothetical protein